MRAGDRRNNWIRELGFAGRVISSDTQVLECAGPHAGYYAGGGAAYGGANGEVFNVNGDAMAVAIASSWGADRLVFLTDVPGVMGKDKAILPVLTIA